jgi:hypothetical protein
LTVAWHVARCRWTSGRSCSAARNVFFPEQAQFGEGSADGGWTHHDLLGRGQLQAQLLERRLRGRLHEGPQGVTPRGSELSRRAAPVRFGGDIARGALARQQVADTAQTDAEPGGQLPHGALMVLVSLHDPET